MPRPNRYMEKWAVYIGRDEKKEMDALAERLGVSASDLFREGLAWVLAKYRGKAKPEKKGGDKRWE